MSPSDDSINKKTCTPWAEKMKMKLLKWNWWPMISCWHVTFRRFNKWKCAHSIRWAEYTIWKVKSESKDSLCHCLHFHFSLTWFNLHFQGWCGNMHPVGGEHHPADRPRLQHLLHGLLLHQGEFSHSLSCIWIHYIANSYSIFATPSSLLLRTSSGSCSKFTLLSTTSPSHPPLYPSTWTEPGLV